MKLPALVLVLTTTAVLAGCGGGGKSNADSQKPAPAGPAATASMSPEAAEATAMANVNQVAPRLQAYFATHGYPTDLAGLAKSMTQAGLYIDPSNSLASYKFDPKNKQWSMCIENDNGAWASFDTGAIGGHGKTGGCPKS